jgi:hypothetical protein
VAYAKSWWEDHPESKEERCVLYVWAHGNPDRRWEGEFDECMYYYIVGLRHTYIAFGKLSTPFLASDNPPLPNPPVGMFSLFKGDANTYTVGGCDSLKGYLTYPSRRVWRCTYERV